VCARIITSFHIRKSKQLVEEITAIPVDGTEVQVNAAATMAGVGEEALQREARRLAGVLDKSQQDANEQALDSSKKED
jgi:hypothetical protein